MLEVNLNNLELNVEKVTTANRKLIAVVKNNGYGNGALMISRHLIKIGVDFLLVNDIIEGIPLLQGGINEKLLVHNPLSIDQYYLLNEYPNLVLTVNSYNDVVNLSKANVSKINVHIQIDSGMNRLGIKSTEEFEKALDFLINNSKFNLEGIYTHFSSPNTMDKQLEYFKLFTSRYDFKYIHCAATSTVNLTDYGTHVRVGLGLYDINQVMSIKAKPIRINNIKANEAIGYESEYIAKEDIKVAVIPIGYGDGYRRHFEGFHVYANGRLYPIIGRICMNHIFVIVDEDINLDTEFELLSENLKASELANYINASNYEIYTMFKVNGVRYIHEVL